MIFSFISLCISFYNLPLYFLATLNTEYVIGQDKINSTIKIKGYRKITLGFSTLGIGGSLLPNKNETTSLITNQNMKVKLIFINDLKASFKEALSLTINFKDLIIKLSVLQSQTIKTSIVATTLFTCE